MDGAASKVILVAFRVTQNMGKLGVRNDGQVLREWGYVV